MALHTEPSPSDSREADESGMGSQGCWECAIGEEGALIDGVKYAAVHPWGWELSLPGTSSPGLVGRSGCREPWCARLEASVCVVVVLVAAHTN